MKILEYIDLDTSRVKRQYEKLKSFLAKDDFSSAEVKKLADHGLYRAKLDDANRLLFTLRSFHGGRYALILEVVHQHAYEKSKFLRGIPVDEAKIPAVEQAPAASESLPVLRYVNPALPRFHFLDKVISFDPEQQDTFQHRPPVIIIGPAGSGKTALTLEKMKQTTGRVLYVTLSRYLADNSRNLYYATHYENEDQEISFLSFREFLETMRVPEGREITYSAFAKWFLRIPKQQRVSDAHRLYEEFRGVLTGSIVDKPHLSRAEYLNLGVRQSVYLAEERELAYTLFEKYLSFLKESSLFDPNMLAHSYLPHAAPTYDFIIIDEVQDITNIQLQLVLRSLKQADQFILCGDSNQIVHPNFFTWSGLKSMLYNAESLEAAKVTRILQSNFRNSMAITDLANRLLRIKQKRFGSIDRESAYLMNSVSDEPGEIVFLRDSDKAKRELSRQTRRSAKFAVLVMRDEDKAAVRQFFDTPLLFSIQEAKGLEYENVVLVNFITTERTSFREIVEGVDEADLSGDLEYRRARDKTDKSLEVYKFFVNSLYVAITRAVKKLYLIESDVNHHLIGLLGVRDARETVALNVKQSSIEEWQAEAHKLELQGRQDQADEIRRDILKTQPVPWEVCTSAKVIELLGRARDPKEVSQKPRKSLFEYGLFYHEPRMIDILAKNGFDRAKALFIREHGYWRLNEPLFRQQRLSLLVKYSQEYGGKFYQSVMKQCETYGVDHRTAFNKTPLMLAAETGNVALLRELLASGADAELTDNYGRTSWQSALLRALHDKEYAAKQFPMVHEILVPSYISLRIDDRLIKLDAKQGEFLLFHTFFALFHFQMNRSQYAIEAPSKAAHLTEMIETLPDSVIPAYRKKRAYTSSLLSKNETDSTNPYGRKLFKRKKTGWYLLNPKVSVRYKDEWIDVYKHAGLDLIEASGMDAGEHFQKMIEYVRADGPFPVPHQGETGD
ncbi:MAG: PhoH family protein [Nitrospirota bacterium]